MSKPISQMTKSELVELVAALTKDQEPKSSVLDTCSEYTADAADYVAESLSDFSTWLRS